MKRILNVVVFMLLLAAAVPAVSQERKDERRKPERLCRKCEKIVARMQTQCLVISNEDFEKLSSYVESVNMDDDRGTLIKVAVMGNNFTSEQCAKLLSFFSFDSNRVEALKVLRPYVVELKNSKAIIDKFTFSSNKDEAMKILLGE
ncbi:MAG: DUF4476 domain-containing protein [Bacteroidaceae bacterium]|nr:DUF4476 domain-containing protein [Bacteroidaceae bacterium]